MKKASKNQTFSSENPFLAKSAKIPVPLDNGFSKVEDKHRSRPGKFGHSPYQRNIAEGRPHRHND